MAIQRHDIVDLKLKGNEAVYLAGSILLMMNKMKTDRYSQVTGFGLLSKLAALSDLFDDEEHKQLLEGSKNIGEDRVLDEGFLLIGDDLYDEVTTSEAVM